MENERTFARRNTQGMARILQLEVRYPRSSAEVR